MRDDTCDTYPGCLAMGASEKAVLVRIPALNGDFWIPRKMITDDSEVFDRNTSGKLVIKGWFGIRLLEEVASRRKAIR